MILKDQRMYLGERELTTDLMALAMEYGTEPQDDTRFGDQTRVSAPGLFTAAWNVDGYWSAAEPDEYFFSNVGLENHPFTVMVEDGDVGSLAYMLLSDHGNYDFLGTVGDQHQFSVGGLAASPLVRGTVLYRGTVNSVSAGTAINLGAIAADEVLYAAAHVISVSGGTPSLNIDIQSDDASGFLSAVNRIDLGTFSGIGFGWDSETNTISDTWWRVNFPTVSGTFEVAVVAGIV